MKCIIIDDNPLACEGLRMYIEEMASLELIGEFDSLSAAQTFLSTHYVDLMFCETTINGTSVIDFINNLPLKPLVIFTTLNANYAVDSYEINAVDYLLKPIKSKRFQTAIIKAEKHAKMLQLTSQYEARDNYIYIRSNRELIKIEFDELLYIEGLKDYVQIYAIHGKFITAMNIKTIMSKLPQTKFFRVSKSYIVNLNHIEEVVGNHLIVKGKEVPIGRAYKKIFLDYINNCMLKK